MLPNFEFLFSIPEDHDLVLTRSRARGGVIRGEYWSHEELDRSGTVIARYESRDEVDAHGHSQRGWRKYDSTGTLAEERTVSESWPMQPKRQLSRAA